MKKEVSLPHPVQPLSIEFRDGVSKNMGFSASPCRPAEIVSNTGESLNIPY
jgi:hypothetical protein